MPCTMEEPKPQAESLPKQLHLLQSQLEARNAELAEYKHQLKSAKEREAHYLYSLDVLQSKEKQEVDGLRARIKQLQEEFASKRQNYSSELAKKSDHVVKLQDELADILKKTAEGDASLGHTSTDEFYEENLFLEAEIQTLADDLKEKRQLVENLQEQHAQLSDSIKCFQLEQEQINENIEFKKRELGETYTLMNSLQEEIRVTNNELESLNNNSLKHQANSLFSEVNDRRLEQQETLLSLTDKCNKMKLEISIKQKQIGALRLQQDDMRTILKDDIAECGQDYKTLLHTYLSRISTLEGLCEQYRKIVLEKHQLSKNGLPANAVDFVNNLYKEKRDNEEKLNEAIAMEFRAQKMMLLELKEITSKVQEWKNIVECLQNKCDECKSSLEQLKLKKKASDECPPETNSEEKNDGCVEKVEKKEQQAEEQPKETTCKEKKVQFSADTDDLKQSEHRVRRGRKVIHSKTVHIPNIVKKKGA